LIGIAADRAGSLLEALRSADSPHAAWIGHAISRRGDGALIEIQSPRPPGSPGSA
jgi:hypothetical protein